MHMTTYNKSFYITVLIFFCCAVCAVAQAQQTPPAAYGSASGNFVRSWAAMAPDQSAADLVTRPSTDVHQATQYVDGLGKPLQTVVRQGSPLGNDLVTTHVYDARGREAFSYLPFSLTAVQGSDVANDGSFKLNAFGEDVSFSTNQYPGENYYYSQNNFEPSPMSRVLNNYPAGNSWVGQSRGDGYQYLINSAQDSVYLWMISDVAGSLPAVGSSVMYPAGELEKLVVTDANGHTLISYRDSEGHVVLKRVQSWASPAAGNSGWLNTYYVYDDVGNVRFVIPPLAVDWLEQNSWNFSNSGGSGVANALCFRYEYDERDRMTIKKAPGAGEFWMVYDSRDRMVMNQDANTRNAKEWEYTVYDNLNRSTSTGVFTDNTNYNSLTYYLQAAAASSSYPTLSNFTNDTILTRTFYDDYTWVPTYGYLVSGTRNTTYDNLLPAASNTSFPYAQPATQSTQTRGLVTGVWAVLLGTPDALGTADIYDDRARLIQTQMNSIVGALDVADMQYSFSGQLLTQVTVTGKTAEPVVTKNNYDAMGRLLTVYKNVDKAASDQLISTNSYNELGELSNKALGNAVDALAYTYNIRNWLTGINTAYVGATGNSGTNYFGLELSYDKTSSVTGTSYANPSYNGNIGGLIWKSGGDGVARKYDFSYDNADRFAAADFNQLWDGATWGKSNPNNSSSSIDFSVNYVGYDDNGNIQHLGQQGFKMPSSSAIDQLQYTYTTPWSNQLAQVIDTADDPNSKLGDFHYNPATKTSTDYVYDANGNLIQDNNKGISNIVYNHLNLPQQIHINGKGTIVYLYDALGKKWEKTTVDSTASPVQTHLTLYMEPFVYQDTVKSLLHEEGKARWAFQQFTNGDSANSWQYDFFERDHLGDTRVILTQEKDTAQYMATMEAKFRATENQLFYGIDSSCYARSLVPGYPDDLGTTNPNDSVIRVNGNGPKMGPSIILKVMRGDQVSMGVQYYYNNMTPTGNTPLQPGNLLLSLATGLSALATPTSETFAALSNATTSPLLPAIGSAISNQNGALTTQPQAYLNWVLLDNQFNYVGGSNQSMAMQVQNAGLNAGALQKLSYSQLPLQTSGYLYIYVSNATQGWDVFFDNLSVTHYSGPMLEENHYYPFGLTMAGISDKALKNRYNENKYRFNKGSELQNKEFSDGTGLEMYDTHFRQLDPQLGRWWQIDPKPDVSASPYSLMNNDPIASNDPLGDTTIFYGSAGNQIFVVNDNGKNKVVVLDQEKEDNFYSAFYYHWVPVKDKDRNLNNMSKELSQYGKSYDVEAFSKFYDKNSHAVPATTVSGESTKGWTNITLDGKPAKLYAEVEGNLVIKDGVVTAGTATNSAGDMTFGYPMNIPMEPNTVGNIHTHPVATNATLSWSTGPGDRSSGTFTAGPSGIGGDQSQAGSNMTDHGVRNVVVDQKNIYLINGNGSQTITIPKK